jgi:RNA polymerase subunit RPABC4/transcription elongation factor Spt4
MNTSTEICPNCDAALPEFGEPCPGCGAMAFFCPHDGCGSVITTAMATCPACGRDNADFVPATTAAADDAAAAADPLNAGAAATAVEAAPGAAPATADLADGVAGETCRSCHAMLPEFGEPCPACGAISFFCTHDGCGAVITTAMPACPACGQTNGDYAPPAAADDVRTPEAPTAAEPARHDAGPARSDEEPYVSPLLQAAAEYGDGAPAKPAAASPQPRSPPPPPHVDLAAQVSPRLEAAALAARTAASLAARPTAPVPAAPAPVVQRPGTPPAGVVPHRTVANDLDKYGQTLTGTSSHGRQFGSEFDDDGYGGVGELSPHGGQPASVVGLAARAEGGLRVNHQGIVQMRLSAAPGLRQPVVVRVAIEVTWQRGVRQWPPQRLAPGGRCDLPPLRLVPTRAGSEAALVRLELVADGVVIERSSGTARLDVDGGDAGKSAAPVGSPQWYKAMNDAIGGGSGGRRGDWQDVELTPEVLASDVVPRNAPAWPAGIPRSMAAGHVQVDLARAGGGQAAPATTLVAVGQAAAFGRGGMPDVCWWVRPAPFDPDQWNRLSRAHLRLHLSGGRLWATDVSSAGSACDGEPLVRDVPVPVPHGATLDLAGVVRLRVALLGDGRRVGGAVLHRLDALGQRLAYALCDPATPVPLLVPPGGAPLWACGPWADVTDPAGGDLHVAAQAGTDATRVGPWEATAAVARRYAVRCHRLDNPRDQNQILTTATPAGVTEARSLTNT